MLDPELKARLDAWIGAFNAGDEGRCGIDLAPGFTFGGDAEGMGFSTVRGALGRRRVSLLRAFGGPYGAALLVALLGEDPLVPEGEGIWEVDFDPGGRITRIAPLWDPPAGADADPRFRSALDRYFATYNAGEEEAHFEGFAPDLVYRGTLIEAPIHGVSAVRGIFRAAHAALGILGLVPLRVFGRGPELAALVGIYKGQPGHAPDTEGIWVFRLDGEGRIRELVILWSPAALLAGA